MLIAGHRGQFKYKFSTKKSYIELLSRSNIVSIFSAKKILYLRVNLRLTQPAFTCSKLTVETLKQGVKYVQS